MKQVIIATKNKGKADEFKVFFRSYGIEALSLLDLNKDIVDVEETGSTFSENAALKSETISNLLGCPVIADDSGLIVDELGGEPGIYSARYAGEDKNDQKNIDKLLRKMDMIPDEKRSARFICVLAFSIPGESTNFFTGYCEGEIATKQNGTNGFGYDPIFIPEGYTKTMAELEPAEKNRISHRSYAFLQLQKWTKMNLKRDHDA